MFFVPLDVGITSVAEIPPNSISSESYREKTKLDILSRTDHIFNKCISFACLAGANPAVSPSAWTGGVDEVLPALSHCDLPLRS